MSEPYQPESVDGSNSLGIRIAGCCIALLLAAGLTACGGGGGGGEAKGGGGANVIGGNEGGVSTLDPFDLVTSPPSANGTSTVGQPYAVRLTPEVQQRNDKTLY